MKVLVSQSLHKDGLKILQDAELELKLISGPPWPTEEDLIRESKDCDAIISTPGATVSRRLLESNSKLKVVARPGVGLERFDLNAATEMGIPIIFSGDAVTETVAEHTVALILALARNIVKADRTVREGNWSYTREERRLYDIEGKSLGVVGFGRIGRMVTAKARALGMKTIAFDPFIAQEEIGKMGAEPVDLETLLKTSDYVTLHTPLTEDTHHLIGKEQLELMKNTAFLINTSRGEVVDEEALVEALQTNRIAGAGIDVLEGWRPKPDNPIFKLDNAIITPHIAFLSVEGGYRTTINVANDVVRALRGETPKWLGNPEVLSKSNLRIRSVQI